MKTPFSFLPAVVVLLTITSFLAPSKLAAQSGSSCKCEDIPYLINLLNEANAALDTLQQAEKTVKPNEMFNEIAPDPNPTRATRGTLLVNAINEAMSLARDKQAKPASSECSKSIKEFQDDRRRVEDPMTKTLAQFIFTARGIYNSDINEILRRLSSIRGSCRPSDWFGTITTVDTNEMNGVITTPAQNEFDLEDKEITKTKTTRTGTIRVDGKSANAFSSWRVGGNDSYSDVKQGLEDCDRSDKGIALVASKSEVRRESEKTGSDSLHMEVSLEVSEDDRSVLISFRLPALQATVNGEETDAVSGGCTGSNPSPKRNSINWKYPIPSEDIQFKASILPGDPEKLSGSKTYDITPPVSTGDSKNGVKRTHSVIISYHLYKLH